MEVRELATARRLHLGIRTDRPSDRPSGRPSDRPSTSSQPSQPMRTQDTQTQDTSQGRMMIPRKRGIDRETEGGKKEKDDRNQSLKEASLSVIRFHA